VHGFARGVGVDAISNVDPLAPGALLIVQTEEGP